MIVDPYTPTQPDVDHEGQSKLAALFAALQPAALLPGMLRVGSRGHRRSGVTKNKGLPRNRARARMAKESRRRNRQ